MIVLDTNVLSELLQPLPDRRVVEWVDGASPRGIATTAVTAAEILFGVARLPAGRKRDHLLSGVGAVLDDDFAGRVLPFDTVAAESFAFIAASRERLGRPIATADAQIAAICRSRGLRLATRNVADFAGTGIELVDPWGDDATS